MNEMNKWWISAISSPFRPIKWADYPDFKVVSSFKLEVGRESPKYVANYIDTGKLVQ